MPSVSVLAQSDYMVKNWRGIGLFNDVFRPSVSLEKLPGADEDIQRMSLALGAHGCELIVHRNQTKGEMKRILVDSLRQTSVDSVDAFICLLWSHGGYDH